MSSFRGALGPPKKHQKPPKPSNMFQAFAQEDKESVENLSAYGDYLPNPPRNSEENEIPPPGSVDPKPSDAVDGPIWIKPQNKHGRLKRPSNSPTPEQNSAPPAKDDRQPWEKDNWRDHGKQTKQSGQKASHHVSKGYQQQPKNKTVQYQGRVDPRSTKLSKYAKSAFHQVKNTMIGSKGVSTRYGDGDRIPGRRTKHFNILYSSINVGGIYYHEAIAPYEGDAKNIPPEDQKFIAWVNGEPFYKKARYWIVIARTRDTVTEVPIYTFNGKALAGKDPKTWWEYFVVCPLGVDPKSLRNWCETNPVLEISFLDEDGAMSKKSMVAHVTEIRTRKIDVKGVKHTGQLKAESTRVVVEAAVSSLGKVPAAEDEV